MSLSLPSGRALSELEGAAETVRGALQEAEGEVPAHPSPAPLACTWPPAWPDGLCWGLWGLPAPREQPTVKG